MARSLGWLALVAPVLALLWLAAPREEHVPLLPVVLAVAVAWTLSALAIRGHFDRAPNWVFIALVAFAPVLVSPFVIWSDGSETGFVLLFVWAAPYAFCWFSLRVAAAETAVTVACFAVARVLSPYSSGSAGELVSETAILATTIVAIGLFARALTNTARRQEQIRTQRERVLAEFGRETLDNPDPHAFVDHALRIAATELHADVTALCRLDAERDLLTFEGFHAPVGGGGWSPGDEVPGSGGSLVARGLREGLVVVDDIWADERVRPVAGVTRGDMHAGIAVAIRGRHGATLGALGVYSATPGYFSADDAAFLQSLANLVAAAKDNLAAEAELRHRALHDPLTGLPNRTLLADRLEHALAACRDPAERVAVLLIDVDRFKHVNDSLGHPIGDELLIALAQRLRASVRAGDTLARMGGDEFVIVAERVSDVAHALEIADRIADSWSVPLPVGARSLHVTASVGVAMSTPGAAGDELLAGADAAMYRAKGQGGANSALFDEGLRKKASTQLRTEQELRRAVERDEVCLHFQPIVDPTTLRCRSLEALARWQHPERGLVGPGEFIPIAEASGLILPLGARVLELGLEQLAAWRREESTFADVGVSVNVSASQLRQPTFVSTLRATLDRVGLRPSALTLEITERALLRPEGPAVKTARELRRLGVNLALDDFGTGYSSLSTLRSLPVTIVKIDRSFLDGLGRDEADTGVISGIMQMAAGARLTVVAEGVETEEQAHMLVSMGCDAAQGYHYARPLETDDAVAFVRRAGLVSGAKR
jgi:diguanylate cyclase (GGDEF)-like protein